ncbi:MAG: glucose-6-phosphate isomerase [Deltaproteobacteria bacterium]|jgi:glucose-6-phosphate isomerase|nr:glucose-6-phosphate isomerase [Deltaproteobacteria bacterium]
MLNIDFTNLMSEVVGKEDGITNADLNNLTDRSGAAHSKIQEWRKTEDAIFYDYVFRDDIFGNMQEVADKTASEFDNVVVLGIGGSALGLRCAAQALLPPYWNLLDSSKRGGKPRLFVCDNIDPDTFSGMLNLVDMKKTCFTIISKSGRTTETASQFLVVLQKLKKELGEDWRKNVVIITDPKSGELRPMVEKEGLTSFEIYPKLGGRFSVLSPVGLFPAACVGIDIKGLVHGAKCMAERCATNEFGENIAYQLGGYQYLFDVEKRKNISVMMAYSDALMLAADWYAQLWAESLGKSKLGQTPVKAVGTTDQHSQVQLYMDGPDDKVFNFLALESFNDADATRIENPPEAFSYIDGKNMGIILNAERIATTNALAQMKRPNLTVTFPTVDASHLGEFFMLYELATAYAGALYGIDPFNQPGVELGKKLTKEILLGS